MQIPLPSGMKYLLMDDFLINNGCFSLFILSFLASTLLPLGSEWLLVVMVLRGHDAFLLVGVATAGNYLGACTTYLIGIWGSSFLIQRVLRINDTARIKAEHLYEKYGSWTLLFSWFPVIGDPICLAGGVLGVGFFRFSLLVFLGKVTRYIIVAMLAMKGM
jgi:membrane protein YqaA with SNARE-associated domain